MTVDPRLPDLYLDAVELDAAGREALLATLRLKEPELATALERLLARPETEASPIDRPPHLVPPSVPELPAPSRVGPYRVLREIGRGGMGQVFLAEQETPDFKRTVALKLIHHHNADDAAVRRFRDEVRILAALDHPGIARFLDGGRSPEGTWYLALEYVEGADLVTHADRQGLDTRQRMELLAAVAEAVGYAHERGVVHRDLKPANILIAADGRPRLLDFGISKLLDPEEPGATTTQRDGPRPLTPAYASPEQLAGGPATAASDVYSLGVTLYELLCGERPTTSGVAGGAARPPSEILRRTASAPSPRRLMRALDGICDRALRQRPAERYPDGASFARALREALVGRPALPARRWRGLAVALLAALACGLFVWVQYPSGSPGTATGAAPVGKRVFPFDPVSPGEIPDLEARFAAAPDDVAAGAALALKLAKESRADEAAMVVGRLRQIPGRELDPLTDFAEGRIAGLHKERQRSLFFLTRARDTAIATGRTELLAEIRGQRGTELAALGQREAAIAEFEQALVDAEKDGDSLRVYRTLNDLAIERLQSGELVAGEALLQRALRAAVPAGVRPLVVLGNLAEVQTQRGRPDLAEQSLAQLLELRRKEPSPLREAQVEVKRFEALRDLGRTIEAETALTRAIGLLATPEGDLDRAVALFARADADLDAARFERVDGLLAAIEKVARERLDRRALGLAHQLRARREALIGTIEAARTEFAESHRILSDQGDLDLAARSDLAWASAEAFAEADDEALRLAEGTLDPRFHPEAEGVAFFAAALRIRLEARRGASAEAAARLPDLAAQGADSPSLRRQLALSASAGAVAAAAGRMSDARQEFARALDAARRTGRRVEALELQLEIAALEGAGPAAAARVAALGAEASQLGLPALERRAQALANRLSATPGL